MTQAPDTLDAVSVVARRDAVAIGSAPVRTVSAAAIERSGAAGLQEVLRTIAGVSIKDYGGVGGLKTVSVRNLGSRHTAVSYDGAPVSDISNGQVDIGRFNLDNVSSVSVEIGSSDDIFRNASLLSSSGVLSIQSSKPLFDSVGTNITAKMRAASFATVNPSLRLEQRLGTGWSVAGSAGWLSSRGDYPFTLENAAVTTRERRSGGDVSSLNADMDIFGDLGDGEFTFKTRWFSSERGLPGSVVLYTQNPTERLWDRNLSVNAGYVSGPSSAFRYKVRLGYDQERNRYLDTDPAYPEPEDDRYDQKELSSSLVLLWSPSEALSFSLAQDLNYNKLASSIPECPFPERLSSFSALSAKYETSRLTVVGNLLGTLISEKVQQGSAAPDRHRLSPTLSASWQLSEAVPLRIRASYKDGFRVPTFNDLYYARVGNVLLEPEKARQFNLGVTWASYGDGSSLTVTADAYLYKVRDKIVAIPTMFIWKMRNLGKVDIKGLDIAADYACRLSEGIVLRVGTDWSLQSALDVTDPGSKNYRHQIQYTPKLTGSADASLQTPWCNVSYTVSYVGERYCLSQNIPANRMAPYADHSVSINRTFELGKAGSVHLSAEALNLGNANYEVIRYYPMPGRNYRFTIIYRY